MNPQVSAHGVREAYDLLRGVAARTRDSAPAYDRVADDIFGFQQRWWQLTYGTQRDKDERPGRDPVYMQETGGLRAAATRRGAPRQVVDTGPTFAFVGVTHGLAGVHESAGRPVMGDPSRGDVQEWLERVGEYIIHGSV